MSNFFPRIFYSLKLLRGTQLQIMVSSSLVMVMGYGIIAVPTGIVTVEFSKAARRRTSTQSCPECSAEGHDPDARHCKYCGAGL